MKKNKHKTEIRLKPISSRRLSQMKIYNKKRKAFLETNKFCGIKSHHCTWRATVVHHTRGRIGEKYLDETTWLASCEACNLWCEHEKQKAWEMGFRKDRIGKLN